jgi:hypothetical protein
MTNREALTTIVTADEAVRLVSELWPLTCYCGITFSEHIRKGHLFREWADVGTDDEVSQ